MKAATRLLVALTLALSCEGAPAGVPTKIIAEGTITHIDAHTIEIDGQRLTPSPQLAAELASRVHAGQKVHLEISVDGSGRHHLRSVVPLDK